MPLAPLLVALLPALCLSAVTPALRPYPHQYGVHKLGQKESIRVDGFLNETAWAEVPWSDDFVDIAFGPEPRFQTRFKARWGHDDGNSTLYIGYWLQDPDIWANQTQHDSVIFYDNDAEVFIDPDGACAYYKELEVNALGVTWALTLDRPYIDGGSAYFGPGKYDPPIKAATHVYGCEINSPRSGPCSHWTLELAIPLEYYAINTTVARVPPVPGDLWRWDFSRVEWRVRSEGNRYIKDVGVPADNWVWSPQGAINMHLPERWGMLCWLDSQVNVSSCRHDDTWELRQALAAVYYASHQFSAVNGYFTADLDQLGLPPAVVNGSLGTSRPQMDVDALSPYGFNATITTTIKGVSVKGMINTHRHFTFDPPTASVEGV